MEYVSLVSSTQASTLHSSASCLRSRELREEVSQVRVQQLLHDTEMAAAMTSMCCQHGGAYPFVEIGLVSVTQLSPLTDLLDMPGTWAGATEVKE